MRATELFPQSTDVVERTPETWAQFLIDKRLRPAVERVPTTGWGTCNDGSPYDLADFLVDTLAGDTPWDQNIWWQVHCAMVAHPDYLALELRFRQLYQTEFWLNTAELKRQHPELVPDGQ